MAFVAPTDAEMMEYLRENAEADVMYIWTEAGVSLVMQYRLALGSYNTLRRFVAIEDTKPRVRASVTADYGINPAAVGAAGIAARLALASIVSAWDISKQQMDKEVELRSEAKALRLNRPISHSEKQGMKRAFENVYGKLPSEETPSNDYVAQKMEELEHNEPVASQLDEITSQEDSETVSMSANLDITGKVQIVKKRSKVSLPTGPEQFRLRLRVERNLWIFMSNRFVNRGWLQGIAQSHFDKYTDYFLGKKVMGLEVPNGAGGMQPLSPQWSVVLNYEYRCRKAAFDHVRDDGMTLIDALAAVVRDAEIKELYFTSPIALGFGTKRLRDPPGEEGEKGRKKNKGKGKGKKAEKGGGKGKGKGGKGKLLFSTPDGRQICFGYNGDGCEDANCTRVHVCRRRGCMGPHPMKDCPMAVAPAA